MVLKAQKKKKIAPKSITISGYYSIIIFLLLMIVDRLTKIWALTLNKSIDYGIFAFTYTTNTGAGFSIFSNQNTLLAWIAVIALGIIIYFHNKFPKTGFVLIITGIIGNLIDRVMYGYVIDFINFKFWPIFNAADSFIFIGVVITIIAWWREDKKEKAAKSKRKKRKSSIKASNKKSRKEK